MLAAMRPMALMFGAFVLACDGAGSPAEPPSESKPAPVSPATPAETKPMTTAADPPAQPELSNAVTNIVGRATADVLLRAADRATFRVDAKSHQAGTSGPDRFGGYAVLRRGRALTDAEARELATLLLADASYLPVDKYMCPNDEAYGVRFTHGAEVVELLFVFPCDRVAFLRRASGDPTQMPGEYIDPVADRVLALLRAAAP